MSKTIKGGTDEEGYPRPGMKQSSGGAGGRSPGKTLRASIKAKTVVTRSPRTGYAGASPRARHPRKGDTPNDGE